MKTLVLYDKRFPPVFVDEFLHPEKVSEESYVKHPNAKDVYKRQELSGVGRTGLHCIELRIECKQGSLSVGQLRTCLLYTSGSKIIKQLAKAIRLNYPEK